MNADCSIFRDVMGIRTILPLDKNVNNAAKSVFNL